MKDNNNNERSGGMSERERERGPNNVKQSHLDDFFKKNRKTFFPTMDLYNQDRFSKWNLMMQRISVLMVLLIFLYNIPKIF